MAIRIDAETGGTTTVLHIAGRLETGGASELEALVREAEGRVLLDLSSLDDADPTGLATLRRLEAAGVTLRGVTPYLALRLARGAAAR